MKTKIVNNCSNDLIIFLSGWGCDGNQFKNMTSSSDVLICWDYTNLIFNFDFSRYDNVDLIAYSAGVFIAGLIEDKLPELVTKIAINGNPKVFDKKFGIPQETLDVMKNLNLDNYIQFRKDYLVFDDKELEDFSKNESQRTFESCNEELNRLKEYSEKDYNIMDFDIALLSDNDKIFNPITQREYFKHNYIVLEHQAHNVFSKFKDFDEIFNFMVEM